MAQVITITGSSFGGGHSSSTTYSVTVSAGTASPNTGITKTQLTNGVSITLSDDAINSMIVTVENGGCIGETATATWGATPAPTTPVTPSPTSPPTPSPTSPPTPSPTPPPTSGITWTAITGTHILGDVYSACGDAIDQTYYITESLGPNVQLFNSQDEVDLVSDSGYIKIGSNQYNVVVGQLGSAGTCPTGYSLQLFYYSQEKQSASNLCDGDYSVSGTGYAWLPTSGWTESELLDKILYDDSSGTQLLTSLGPLGTYYRAVSKTSGRSTKDGSALNYVSIDNTTARVGTVGSQTCSQSTPAPGPVTPSPGEVQNPVDTPQEN